jgi:hypothetical protein
MKPQRGLSVRGPGPVPDRSELFVLVMNAFRLHSIKLERLVQESRPEHQPTRGPADSRIGHIEPRPQDGSRPARIQGEEPRTIPAYE